MSKKYVLIDSDVLKEVRKTLKSEEEFDCRFDHMFAYLTGRTMYDEHDHWEEVDINKGLELAFELYDRVNRVIRLLDCDSHYLYDEGYDNFDECIITQEELDILAEINVAKEDEEA